MAGLLKICFTLRMHSISQLLIISICAAIIVLAVRLLLIRGIDQICTFFHWRDKTKGQLIGYATSVPELVVLLSSAWAGVFAAGFWNIASSNIINILLFLSAITYYRKAHALRTAHFIDEIAFAILSVLLPLAMHLIGLTTSFGTAALLLGVFAVYKWLDIRLNKPAANTDATPAPSISLLQLGFGLLILAIGLGIIVVSGSFLGDAAEKLVIQLHTPAWLVGVLLGLITSVPEMTSFFEIYRLEHLKNRPHELNDTQQALDALVASNLCNLGIILPLGILLFLLLH